MPTAPSMWISRVTALEEIHGFFVRSEPDTMNVYEAGDFTYLITTYEVDDHG